MKNFIKYKNRFTQCLGFIFIALIIIALITNSEYLSQGIITGIRFCIEIIVPSLFPFMVLSSFIVNSGIAQRAGKIIEPITRGIFKLPGCAGVAIALSLIGGYPTGIKATAQLYENKLINKQQAEHMSMFCICSGPGFTITAVGVRMLKNFQVGLILFASQIISVLLCGIISGMFIKKADKTTLDKFKPQNLTNSFIESVNISIVAMINLSGLIVIFSGIIEILHNNGVMETVQNFLSSMELNSSIAQSLPICLIEITAGSKLACGCHIPFEMISFFLSFAGMCIHFQIFSILPIHINKVKFLFFRVLSGIIAYISMHILLQIFPQVQQTIFSNTQAIEYNSSQSYIGMICLIFMSIVFILSINRFVKRDKQT